jgi:cobalt-zinc-cadmium resistance protein CzcA
MLARLVQFALAQRLFVLIAGLVLMAGGWLAFKDLPIDAFPDVSSTQVKIIMKAPGMTPEEVESRIALPIEVEMLGIPKQRMLRSVSKYGIVDVTIDFDDGTDIYWARQQVAERWSGIAGDLPVASAAAWRRSPRRWARCSCSPSRAKACRWKNAQPAGLGDPACPALRRRRGRCERLGGKVRSFEVLPDPVKLAAVGLSTAQIKSAIEANNRNDGAGRLGEGDEVLLVRTEGSIKTQDDLRAIVVKNDKGMAVRLGDVAQVREGSVTRYGVVTKDGKAKLWKAWCSAWPAPTRRRWSRG